MARQVFEIDDGAPAPEGGDLLKMTVDVVVAQISNNPSQGSDVPDLIGKVHAALVGLGGPAADAVDETKAVPIMDPRKAVKPDGITCLICGKKSQILKPHLRAMHGLDPNEYRMKFDLPSSYPMASKKYVDAARERAVKLGLGERMKAGRGLGTGKTRAALVGVK